MQLIIVAPKVNTFQLFIVAQRPHVHQTYPNILIYQNKKLMHQEVDTMLDRVKQEYELHAGFQSNNTIMNFYTSFVDSMHRGSLVNDIEIIFLENFKEFERQQSAIISLSLIIYSQEQQRQIFVYDKLNQKQQKLVQMIPNPRYIERGISLHKYEQITKKILCLKYYEKFDNMSQQKLLTAAAYEYITGEYFKASMNYRKKTGFITKNLPDYMLPQRFQRSQVDKKDFIQLIISQSSTILQQFPLAIGTLLQGLFKRRKQIILKNYPGILLRGKKCLFCSYATQYKTHLFLVLSHFCKMPSILSAEFSQSFIRQSLKILNQTYRALQIIIFKN